MTAQTFPTLPAKLGMLDSGVGGLSVLNALLPYLPSEVVYIADAAHLPYGQKSVAFLIDRATVLTQFFESQGITTIFIACHTLSATALPTIRSLFPHITYIDLLPLTVFKALSVTRNNRIGVLATQATISSHIHRKLVETMSGSQPTLIEQPCPDFVSLIEKRATSRECDAAVTTYLKASLEAEVDTIILGCTHYPFIQAQLEAKAPHLTFVSAATALPSFPKRVGCAKIHLVTTAPQVYIEQAVEHFLIKDQSCELTFEHRALLGTTPQNSYR